MPLATFPTLPGLGWDVKKRVMFSNNKEVAKSGAEFSTANWSLPMFEFDVDVNFLSQSDRDTLETFYTDHLGDHLPFLLSVTNDSAKSGATVGVGDGTVTQFQIALPAQTNIVGTPALTVNGATCVSGIAAPGAPALSTVAGGAKVARTNYVRTAYRNSAGGESPASAEASIATDLNFLVRVASPPASTGAVDWRVYVSTATNTETLQATLPIGTDYTEPTSALLAGVAYSMADRSTFTVSATGMIQFASAPLAGYSIKWTGNYAYVVKFKGNLEFNQMMARMYEVKRITFRTHR